MAVLSDLVVRITGQTKDFERAAQKVERQTKSMEKTVSRFGKVVAGVFTVELGRRATLATGRTISRLVEIGSAAGCLRTSPASTTRRAARSGPPVRIGWRRRSP